MITLEIFYIERISPQIETNSKFICKIKKSNM